MSKKEKLFDQDIDRDVLIAAVRDRPVLWNRFLDVYKDKNAKTEAWREICTMLKEDFEEMDEEERTLFSTCVVKRWSQLRDSWKKTLNEHREIRKSVRGTKLKPYKYDQEMSFLKPVMKPSDTRNDSYTKEEVHTQSDSEEDDMEDTFSEASSKKKRVGSGSEVDEKPLKLDQKLKTTGREDRHMHFFKGVLPSLQMFDDDQILEFQSGVINLIRGIKTGESKSDWP